MRHIRGMYGSKVARVPVPGGCVLRRQILPHARLPPPAACLQKQARQQNTRMAGWAEGAHLLQRPVQHLLVVDRVVGNLKAARPQVAYSTAVCSTAHSAAVAG